MRPEEALKRTKGFARGARIVRQLHESPVKTVWLVERRGERFVLRVDRPLARDLGLDRVAELHVMREASRAGFAPEPLLLVPACTGTARAAHPAILVTRYAAGAAWTPVMLREPTRLRRLAFMLRDLHGARLDGPRLDLKVALARYAALAGTAAARSLAAGASRLIGELGPVEATLCHNDPIASNVVGRQRTLLIDWEYAGVGDPLFDLAVVIRHHRLAPRSARAFAGDYFGSHERVPFERLALHTALYDLVLALWALAMRTMNQ